MIFCVNFNVCHLVNVSNNALKFCLQVKTADSAEWRLNTYLMSLNPFSIPYSDKPSSFQTKENKDQRSSLLNVV